MSCQRGHVGRRHPKEDWYPQTYGIFGSCPPPPPPPPTITGGPQGAQGNQGNVGPQGAQGNQGDIGPQGVAGAQGNQGDVGPQGAQGNQGDIGLQGVAGAQGNQGNVGPQGVAGAQGNQGNIGLQGVAGAQGNQGNVGPQGVAGAQGNQGDIGPQGVAGAQGNQGDVGPQGVAGAQGNQGDVGPQGVAGAQGNQGDVGPQGLAGAQGNQGDIGPQGVAGAQGNQGGIGPQGVAGAQGNQGDIGPQGVAGAQGNQGNQGDIGPQGVAGAQGNQGNQGDIGPQGVAGTQGNQGNQGDIGPQGVAGAQGNQGDIGPQGNQGDVGPQGVTGPQGTQGNQGDVGPQGVAGAQGNQGDIGPQGVAGAQGNQGDIGPQGVAGAQGNQGDIGPQGVAGAQGNQGDIGPQGNQGDIGPQGNQGDIGPQGNQGDIGPQGNQGDIGPQGNQGDIGPQGNQGDIGPQGNQGDIGPQGAAGAQGNQGEIGPQGVVGAQGNQGNQGDIGPLGAAGAQGNQGDIGPQGDVGPQGNQGDVGPQGNQGDVGPQGVAGAQGNQGEIGPQGPPGTPTPSLENFRVALAASYAYGGGTFEVIPNWTATVDPGIWPDTYIGNLYNNLSVGNINLTSGVFTCGVTGTYSFSVTNYTTGSAGQYTLSVNSTKYLYGSAGTGYPYSSTALIPMGSVYLKEGDVVSVVSGGANFDYVAYQITPLDSPNLIWTMALEGGSASVTNRVESFQVILGQDFNYTGSGVQTITSWTDTVDLTVFPLTAPQYTYNRINAGSLDLGAGTFVVGTSGVYQCIANWPNAQITVNGKFMTQAGGPNPFTVNLKVGDIVIPVATENVTYVISGGNLDGSDSPGAFWSMTLMQSPTTDKPLSSTSESFMIALNANYNYTDASAWMSMGPFTDAVDTLGFPGVAPETLFQNLAVGNLNLVGGGIFTVGISGSYAYSLGVLSNPGYVYPFISIFVNGKQTIQAASAGQGYYGFSSGFMNLKIGDIVQLRVYDYTGSMGTIPYFDIGPDRVDVTYTTFWGLSLQTGGKVAPESESFSVRLTETYIFTGPDPEVVTNWTDIPDLVNQPGFCAEGIYNNLTLGSLNLAAGVFTCGVSGTYMYSVKFSGYIQAALSINTTPAYPVLISDYSFSNGIQTPVGTCYLNAGDTVNLITLENVPYQNTEFNGNTVPFTIWTMALVGGTGGGVASEATREAFQITLATDFTYSGSGFDQLINFTDVLDTVSFPQTDPGVIFNQVTLGNLNPAAGYYIAGQSGVYDCSLSAYTSGGNYQISINTKLALPVNFSTNQQLIYLQAGDSATILVNGNMPYMAPGQNLGLTDSPNVIWSMSLVHPGPLAKSLTPAPLSLPAPRTSLASSSSAPSSSPPRSLSTSSSSSGPESRSRFCGLFLTLNHGVSLLSGGVVRWTKTAGGSEWTLVSDHWRIPHRGLYQIEFSLTVSEGNTFRLRSYSRDLTSGVTRDGQASGKWVGILETGSLISLLADVETRIRAGNSYLLIEMRGEI